MYMYMYSNTQLTRLIFSNVIFDLDTPDIKVVILSVTYY